MSATKMFFHGASWCPSCHQIRPYAEGLCAKRGAEFVYVDIDSQEPIIENLTSIPAIMIVKENEEPIILRSSAVNVRTLSAAL